MMSVVKIKSYHRYTQTYSNNSRKYQSFCGAKGLLKVLLLIKKNDKTHWVCGKLRQGILGIDTNKLIQTIHTVYKKYWSFRFCWATGLLKVI